MSRPAVLFPSLIGLLLAALLGPAVAAEDDAAGMIRFRRILAPEDRIKDWPLGDGKYLPVDAAEFERLVTSMPMRTAAGPNTPAVAITSARYEAKLEGDHLVGQASAKVFLVGVAPRMLPFEPCNLALGKIVWIGERGVETCALLGLGGNGKLETLVERGGPLRFDWSLAGRRDPADILVFLFEMPAAAANELSIELPKGFSPAIDRGVVVKSEPAGSETLRWRIELGGRHRFHMRILPAGTASHRPQLALLRESQTYDLSMRGVEVSAQWRLQVHNEPLQQVTVLLDPGLELVSAQYGDASLSWSAAPAAGGQGTRAVLTLAEPIRDTERVIRLSAIGQTVLDRPWRLPRIRAEGLFWQEGSITLQTPEPLLTDRIVPFGCAQTGTGPLSAPRAGESMQFQAFQPDATIELFVSRRAATLHVLSAAAIELGDEEATARVATDFHVAEGARFALEADVARHWVIDAVESTPPGAVTDWSLEPQADGDRRLAIRLDGGLSSTKAPRLAITARRPFSPTLQTLGIDDLTLVRFRDTTDAKRLIAVRPAGSYVLKLSDDEKLKRLHADNLTPAELELFASPPQDLLFECDARADALKVSLVGQKAKYAGTIQIDAAVGDGMVLERCLLRCIPESGRVDRLLVQFFPRRDTTSLWTTGGDNDPQMSARKLSDREQALAGWDTSVETWELTLHRPRSVPFEITAVRNVAILDAAAGPHTESTAAGKPARYTATLTLASLPEATSQQGILTVRDLGPRTLWIDNRRLKPILPEPLPPDRAQTVQGVYRYDPVRDVAEGAATAIRVFSNNEPGVINTWVWIDHLESWYQSDGAARHEATYDLQSTGRGRLQLTMPPDVARQDVRGVWIDGDPVEWQWIESGGKNRATVDLPTRRKYPRVAIQWTVQGPRLGIIGSLAPPLPEPDLPVLMRQWTAWLPPGYECFGSDIRRTSARGETLTWSRRLFGPLGRAERVNRFDPMSLGDWMSLLMLGEGAMPSPPAPLPLAGEGSNSWTAAADAGKSATFSNAALLPWASSDNKNESSIGDAQGWTQWSSDLIAGNPVELRFVHGASIQLLGMLVFLWTAILGCWKFAGRPLLLVLALGGFGIVAMILPDVYSPIASGGVLGIVFCLVWWWVYPQVPPPVIEGPPANAPAAPSNPGSTVSMAAQIGLILLGVLLTLLIGGVVRGETPPPDAEKAKQAAPPLYRVLVPIDAKKQPVGEKVYVPEPFYRELYRHAAATVEKPQGWLLRRATYRGVLAAEPVSGHLAVDTLRAEYILHVFGRTARVRIPLRAEGANLLPNGVLLDGRVIEPEWEPDAAALTFEVAEPGEYHLEVLLRPTMRNAGGPAGLDVVIPRVARSQLELTLPNDAPPIEVPSACGTVVVEKDPPRLLADLGPADRLAIRWHEGAASGTTTPAVDVEQFVWLKVQPGSVVISAKFKLHVVEGQIQQVQLAVDPRLRLLPLPGDDPPTVQTGPESGQSRLLAFRWSRPISDQATLETTFLLSGATGVGNFRLPQIELLDARPTRRWMAVSVDLALDRIEQKRQPLEAITVANFLKAWNGEGRREKGEEDLGSPNQKSEIPHSSSLIPQAAYRLPPGEIDWTISTRPHEPQIAGDQSLTLSFDEDHVDLVFEAQVSTTSGYLFQHRLTAPKGLKIEDVSLLEEDVERASRWSQDEDGSVTVFLNDAASGPQKLVLRGSLPIGPEKNWPLPRIRVERCQLRVETVRLFRRPTVLLTIHGRRKTFHNKPPQGGTELSDMGRLVETFTCDVETPLSAITVAIESNRPKVHVQEAMRPESHGRTFLEPVAAPPAAGFIHLADITAVWRADGSCCGTAVFDLDSGGAGECPLILPGAHELIQVSVEGMPVAPKAVGPKTWRFPLATQRLPQRVEVLFRGSVSNIRQRCFEAPMLGDLPVRKTLWTVIGPASWVMDMPDSNATVKPWQQELTRLRSAAAVIESVSAADSDDSEETLRWRRFWTRRLTASYTAMERELAADGSGKEVANAKRESAAIERRNTELASRLGASDSLPQTTSVSFAIDGSGEILRHSQGTEQPIVRCFFNGRANSLMLDCQTAKQDEPLDRPTVAIAVAISAFLAVVGLAGLFGSLFRRKISRAEWTLPSLLLLAKAPWRWPHVIGTLLGLAWWLWLSPSVFGLGIALACVLAAGRDRIKAKK